MDLQYPVISITYLFFVLCSSEATLRPDLPPSTVMFLSSVGAPLLRPGLHTHRPHYWASNIPGVRGQRPRGGRAAATLLQPGALPLPSDTTEIGKRKREGPSNSMEQAPSFSALLLTCTPNLEPVPIVLIRRQSKLSSLHRRRFFAPGRPRKMLGKPKRKPPFSSAPRSPASTRSFAKVRFGSAPSASALPCAPPPPAFYVRAAARARRRCATRFI